MKIKSPGIEEGRFLDRYGSKGDVSVNGMPGLSIPFSIEDAPAGTKSFAAILDDYDEVEHQNVLFRVIARRHIFCFYNV